MKSPFSESPNGWQVDRIRDRMGMIIGGIWGEDTETDEEGVDIPVVRVADIRGLDVATENLTVRKVKASQLVGRLIGDKSILLEKSGGGEQTPVGRAVLARNIPFRAIFSNFMAKAECDHTIYPPFLAYLLNSTYSAGINTAHIQQTTGIQNLRVSDYLNTKVAFPPLPEQERITTYLDSSCSAIDRAVAAKRNQLNSLDALRTTTITRAITRGLRPGIKLRKTENAWMSEVPAQWELVSLKRVSEIQGGLTLGKVYDEPTIERPYLRVANVQDGRLNLDEVTRIEVPLNVARRVELRSGDVLMTEGGDLDKLGRGTIWNGEIPECLHQNHIFAVRCFTHKLLPTFLAYLTASRYGRDYFEATGKRTTNLASTNATKVGLFPIPRPSVPEQQAICEFLDEKVAQIAAISDGIESQIATLNAYRNSLIHECVTGHRCISDADLKRALGTQ